VRGSHSSISKHGRLFAARADGLPGRSAAAVAAAVHMSGMLDGTSSIMGITIGPISGPFEMWASCDIHQPQQAKMKVTGATTAYGVTVLNNTVLTYCSPSATTAGTLYESVA
jgi:hypothetical protein